MIIISKFSGKCDFFDIIDIHGVDNIINKYKIFSHDDILPLEVKESKDFIPYYPYLVTTMVSNKETGGKIILSQKSFIDIEEEEWLSWRLRSLLKYWRRCKRKKIPFDSQEALKQIIWPTDDTPEDYEIELVKRVEEFGDKATADGLHDPVHDRLRQALFDEMVDNGWDKNKAGSWIYGYLRWSQMVKDE